MLIYFSNNILFSYISYTFLLSYSLTSYTSIIMLIIISIACNTSIIIQHINIIAFYMRVFLFSFSLTLFLFSFSAADIQSRLRLLQVAASSSLCVPLLRMYPIHLDSFKKCAIPEALADTRRRLTVWKSGSEKAPTLR